MNQIAQLPSGSGELQASDNCVWPGLRITAIFLAAFSTHWNDPQRDHEASSKGQISQKSHSMGSAFRVNVGPGVSLGIQRQRLEKSSANLVMARDANSLAPLSTPDSPAKVRNFSDRTNSVNFWRSVKRSPH